MAYGITSESQIIDIATIQSAVNKIKTAAKDFSSCGTAVSSAASTCDASALAVDGLTLQPTIEDLAGNIKTYQSEIEGIADSLLSEANQIYNAQMSELIEYRERLKREAEANKK